MNLFTSGFLLVRTQAWLTDNCEGKREDTNSMGDVSGYRGVDRAPLRALNLEQLARRVRLRKPENVHIEPAAALAMAERQAPRLETSTLPTLDDARDVYCLLSNPGDWELVWLVEMNNLSSWIPTLAQAELLGFDAVNFPWSFKSPLRRIATSVGLNQHGLIDTLDEARGFIEQHISGGTSKDLDTCSVVGVYGFSPVFHAQLLSPGQYFISELNEPLPAEKEWLPGYSHEVRLLSFTPKTNRLRGVAALTKHTSMTLTEALEIIDNLPRRLCLIYFGMITKFEQALMGSGFEIQSWPIAHNEPRTDSANVS